MGASRIANVSAAVLVGSGQGAAPTPKQGLTRARGSAALADLVTALFDDTLQVGDSPNDRAIGRFVSVVGAQRDSVVSVAAAIEAARSERVIVFAEEERLVGAELLLALVAWPEHAAVWVVEGERLFPVCAIYRREDLLASARSVLANPSAPISFETFLSRLEVERVTLARLGLDSGPHPLFAGREWREAC